MFATNVLSFCSNGNSNDNDNDLPPCFCTVHHVIDATLVLLFGTTVSAVSAGLFRPYDYYFNQSINQSIEVALVAELLQGQ